MNGRCDLLAWANEAPDDWVKLAVRKADRAANDDDEGSEEHAAFVTAIIAALGLKRSTGRPSEPHLAGLATLLSRFRHWQGRSLTHGEIVRALIEPGVVSETTIRNHLRTIDKRRESIWALLASATAQQGRTLMMLDERWPSASRRTNFEATAVRDGDETAV